MSAEPEGCESRRVCRLTARFERRDGAARTSGSRGLGRRPRPGGRRPRRAPATQPSAAVPPRPGTVRPPQSRTDEIAIMIKICTRVQRPGAARRFHRGRGPADHRRVKPNVNRRRPDRIHRATGGAPAPRPRLPRLEKGGTVDTKVGACR